MVLAPLILTAFKAPVKVTFPVDRILTLAHSPLVPIEVAVNVPSIHSVAPPCTIIVPAVTVPEIQTLPVVTFKFPIFPVE